MSEVVALTLRIPRELHPRMRVRAAKAEKSLNAWIADVLAEVTEMEEEDERVEQTRAAPAAPR